MDIATHPPTLSPPSIHFRRVRDVSGVINVAFAFLRENWRGLGRALLTIAGPALVLGVIIETMLAAESLLLSVQLPLLYHLFLVAPLMQAVVVAYVLEYIEHGAGGVEQAAVRSAVARSFAGIAGTSFLVSLASIFGLLFIIVPGVYLFVATSVAITARGVENISSGSAFGRSIELVRGHWWPTFGLLAVATIIALLSGFIIELPALVPYFIEAFGGESFVDTGDDLIIAAGSVASAAGSIVSVAILSLAEIAQYFSLVERKEGPGALAKIEEIGGASVAYADGSTSAP